MKVEQITKKVLRKWLKKKLYDEKLPLSQNIARFKWVYNSPLRQWRDRIWVANYCCNTIGETEFDRYFEYLYS